MLARVAAGEQFAGQGARFGIACLQRQHQLVQLGGRQQPALAKGVHENVHGIDNSHDSDQRGELRPCEFAMATF